jgi:hypothetical protein
VSFPAPEGSSISDRLKTELRLLMPWWERGRTERGFTATGVLGLDIYSVAEWLAEFVDAPMPADSPSEDLALADAFKLAVEELKAFYLEAATARPGGASHRELNDWFWDQTAAGELLWLLRDRARTHEEEAVRLHAAFTLVPESQVRRKETA